MVDRNLTEIVVILDRSGSMASIAADMKGGFDSFIKEQKKLPGKCVVTLVRFDTNIETVYEEKNVNLIHGLELIPRGSTALRDAVGQTIVKVGERLAAKPEDQRPGCVVFLIITDGEENASKEYVASSSIRNMIQHQESVYNWKFVYLGTESSTFNDAMDIGLASASMGNFTKSARGVGLMYTTSSNFVRSLRAASAQGQSLSDMTYGAVTEASLSDEDKEDLVLNTDGSN